MCIWVCTSVYIRLSHLCLEVCARRYYHLKVYLQCCLCQINARPVYILWILYFSFGNHFNATQRTNLCRQPFFWRSIVCVGRTTASRQSIVKVISQYNSEIGCSILMKQWDYMSASEQEGLEEIYWKGHECWELFERKTTTEGRKKEMS